MILIPAIDLKDGNCVRLLKGRRDRETVYADDPVEMARHWVRQGAKRLHVVDLDGAFERPSENKPIILEILSEVDVPCQVGGGLRSIDSVRKVLGAGADSVVIGTAGIKNPDFLRELRDEFPSESIIAGVDCEGSSVMVRGWEEDSARELNEWIETLEQIGIRSVVYTDIARDGTQDGPNTDAIEDLLDLTSMQVIASGGIGSTEHLRDLGGLDRDNLTGVITGRALYEGSFTLPEGQQALEGSGD